MRLRGANARLRTRTNEPRPKHLLGLELAKIESAPNGHPSKMGAWSIGRQVTIQKEALVRKRMKKCPNLSRLTRYGVRSNFGSWLGLSREITHPFREQVD